LRVGQSRANAASVLLQLGKAREALGVWRMTDDPEATTQFLAHCKLRGVTLDQLLQCWDLLTGPQAGEFPSHMRYGLLLALGEFQLVDLPPDRGQELVDQLAAAYGRDPSRDVHSAAGWLLRAWGQHEIAQKQDETEVPYHPEREWFNEVIEVQPRGESGVDGSPPPKRRIPLTWIVFPKGTAEIGSGLDEQVRSDGNRQVTVEFTRSFAVMDREVTMEEMLALQPGYAPLLAQFGAEPKVAAFAVDWLHAVAYAQWLSAQRGLPESEWAYTTAEAIEVAKASALDQSTLTALRNVSVNLNARGFRLPTEAEWEVMARGGVRTAFGMGSDPGSLQRFAWFEDNSRGRVQPPRQLRPTLQGLFDIQGNVWEWVHDWYEAPMPEVVIDHTGPATGTQRVYRGGSWNGAQRECRLSKRMGSLPETRAINLGFRLARTLGDTATDK